jgi:hypothetical protein
MAQSPHFAAPIGASEVTSADPKKYNFRFGLNLRTGVPLPHVKRRRRKMKKGTLSIGIAIPVTLIVLTLVALVLMNQARASVIVTRQTCQFDRSGHMGQMMGARNAQRIFNAIWARLGQTCDQLDRMAGIIADTPLSQPMMGGAFAACFYEGYTDTLWQNVSNAYDRCQVRCFNEGTDIGRISAEGYCAASIAVGGLNDPGFIAQPPLPFCGENIVFGCKSQYIQTATMDIQACLPYTEGAFSTTFDNSVRQDCFVPADVPIHDGLQNASREDQPLADLL